MKIEYTNFDGFDWDDGNKDKNLKHKVHNWECEQLFFNEPIIILEDSIHSITEERFAAFGKTDNGRRLIITYTRRTTKIRVISARDMNRKERDFYENFEK
ncbi:MAG: hypothetical protein ACD_79C01288G0006 [uncultured bacterium]|nr:MAG: hypothetical protein ACD_79C01288G0006 [uncultured bacterium]